MVILSIGILFFLAHLLALGFERFAVPDVLVLLLVGMVAGPLLGLVGPESFGHMGEVLSSVTLVAILFEGGMSLELRRLGPTVGSALPLFALTFAGTLALAAGLGAWAFGFSLLPALAFGCIIGSISPAVVLPLAKTLRLGKESSDRLTVETSLTDVFSIVLVFTLVGAAGSGDFALGKLIGSTLSALVFAAIIGLGGSYLWLRSLPFVRRFPNTTLATFAFLFIVYGLSEFLGFSGAIAALAFGLGVANRPFGIVGRLSGKDIPELSTISEAERSLFDEVIFLLKTFFFLYLGISMRFPSLVVAAAALGLVLAIYVLRILAARRVLPTRTAQRDAILTSFMAPKGLASAVLAGIPLASGIEGAETMRDLAYFVILLSIIASAVLVFLEEKTRCGLAFGRIFEEYPENPEPRP